MNRKYTFIISEILHLRGCLCEETWLIRVDEESRDIEACWPYNLIVLFIHMSAHIPTELVIERPQFFIFLALQPGRHNTDRLKKGSDNKEGTTYMGEGKCQNEKKNIGWQRKCMKRKPGYVTDWISWLRNKQNALRYKHW